VRFRSLLLGGLAIAGLAACGREPVSRRPTSLAMMLDTTRGAANASIVVVGVDSENQRVLESRPRTTDDWTRLFRVSVVGSDVPIAGRYSAANGTVVFEPASPFDRGRAYTARFDPRALPTPAADTAISIVAGLPRDANARATAVVRVLPTADTLPENLLRMYVEFSAPMSRMPGVDFIHLIDDGGNEVKNAFLPLDADSWNPEHTRYTIFLDPKRVKRGIKPNEQTGRALHAGRAYALRIDSTWKDANGLPIAHSFRREFQVGPAAQSAIVLADWGVQPPKSGTREPLVIRFPRALDHALLQRAIGVRVRNGERIPGTIVVAPQETEWRFVPRSRWQPGPYDVVVLAILEDVAGNRVNRPFEIDDFKAVDSSPATEEYRLPFRIR
jgi:hypothetical protein